MRLHLGCGKHHIDGYINIDIVNSPAVDIVADVALLKRFSPNSIDVIYACNVLEHLGRFKYKVALARWFELLKKGGVLRLSVPDLAKVFRYYHDTGDLDTIMCAVYAGQDSPQNFHYWGWNYWTLSRDLKEIGFDHVREYDRDKTDHAHIRDWSLNYMPYHDKDGNELPDEEWFKGYNIALNVEAIK